MTTNVSTATARQDSNNDAKSSNVDQHDTPKPPDPFDPARLRLSQQFGLGTAGKALVTRIPDRKPAKEWFIRVHPCDDYCVTTAGIELKDDDAQGFHLVDPTLWPMLDGNESTFSARMLCLGINRQGILFVWPLKIPSGNGCGDLWNRTALEAANLARTRWVRVQANRAIGAYEVFAAPDGLPEPEWPDTSMADILRSAFRDKFIDTLDHPILKQLRGEA